MIARVLTLLFLLGGFCLFAGAIAHNQISPGFNSAMTVPFANLAGLILALIAAALASFSYRRDKSSRKAKGLMWFVIACALLLAVLLPISDLGYLSRVR